MNAMCCIVGIVALALGMFFLAGPAMAATAKDAQYKGWNTIELDNGVVEVQAAPTLGGRIIQFKLGEFEYLWVNPDLKGKTPPPSGLGPNDSWMNFGGDKLWPAPQGWSGPQEWDGPPDPVLDGGAYTSEVVTKEGSPVEIKLTSKPDTKKTGIQFVRNVKLFDNAARMAISVTMKNVADKPIRWGIWSNTQINAANRYGKGYNKNIWSYTPMNPDSVFYKGYNVLFGQANNPSYKPDFANKMMRVHYERLIGKVALDCSAGWTATVDGTDGYVFVQRFKYEPGKEYTNDASVEIWMDGVGKIHTGDKIWEGTDDPKTTPYCFETEVLSPYADLKPGETYTYNYEWCAARIGGNYPVLNCTDMGVTCETFTASVNTGELVLNGRFGVFQKGGLQVAFYDNAGAEVGRTNVGIETGPAQPFIVASSTGIMVPEKAATVALVVADGSGKPLGELARTTIKRD